ncbi:MAG: DNA repair protein RecN [Desulfovibrionales bacterium]|nr:DNA repair protein RecN [Desulfovibrionales bacterium]
MYDGVKLKCLSSMLLELTIQDFALIANLKISFGPGLNILSGETGAGKSIIIQAIQLVLGGRGGPHLVRTGKEEARIEAYFEYPEDSRVAQKLTDMGIDRDDALIIRRTVSRTGKGRVFINGTAATLQMATQLATELISIAGQHEYQILLRPQNHLFLLDAFGGLTYLRLGVQKDYRKWQELHEQRRQLIEQQNAAAARKDLLAFQLQEIRKANLRIGEEEELIQEKSLLASAEKLREWAQRAYDLLYASSGAVTEKLSESRTLGQSLAGIDGSLAPLVESLDAAFFQVEDIALRLRDYLQKIDSDPGRLETLEDRLQELSRLKKKYDGDIQKILALSAEMEQELAGLEGRQEELAGLEASAARAEEEVIRRALDLSAKRKAAASQLAEAVCRELESLHMPRTRVMVDFSPLKKEVRDILSENGIDEVQFLIAPNIGEDLKPLAQIASGGELSRITLALKSVLTERDGVETTIFDEVDAGIGGAVAEVLGRKLGDLAGRHQVICITHLPQIACFADRHYRVDKVHKGNRSETIVKELSGEERVEEVARMLGGVEISEKTRAHAREMIERRRR